MSKLLVTIFFSFFLFSLTISFAEEGDVERLVVPQTQEESITPSEETDPDDVEALTQEEEPHIEEPQIIDEPTDVEQVPQKEIQQQETQVEETQAEQTDTPIAAETPTENVTEEQSEEVPTEVEGPSEDELEASRAEEAELRDVGAGEEPTVE